MATWPWPIERLKVGGMLVTAPEDHAISGEELAGYRSEGFGHLLEALALLQPQTVVCDPRTVERLGEQLQEESPVATPQEIEASVDAALDDADCDDRLPSIELPVFSGALPKPSKFLGMFYLYNARLVSEDGDLVTITCNAAPGLTGITVGTGNAYLNRVASIMARFMDKRDVALADGRLLRVSEFLFPFDKPGQRWSGHPMHERFKSKLGLFKLTDRDQPGGVLKKIRRPE